MNSIEINERLPLPLLPLRDIVLFPHMVVPLFVGREKSIMAIEHAMAMRKEIFLAAQRDAKIDDPKEKDIYRVGTIGVVLQILRLPDGTVKALIEGRQRAKILRFLPNQNFFIVEVEPKDDVYEATAEAEALIRLCHQTFEEYVKLNKKIPPEIANSIAAIKDPSRLADTIAAHLPLKLEKKQKLLEIEDVNRRLEQIYGLMRGELEIIQLEQRIKERVKRQMEKTQRDYYLNEQMRAIQKEMGEKDDGRSELAELGRRIKKKRLPREVAAKVRQEYKKLKLMSPMSAEAAVVRNYIDWILSLPWYERTQDKLDIAEAEAILDADHFGLEKPKQRILEHLAVQSLVKKIKGPILCLVGPPGVGKTSLARSVARAMGRNFVRISLGGVRDEAEIRGHRRTYIGALPGKIIQGMRRAKTINPVFCLDEVDKIGADFRGDPAAALLEVLDPEQNFAFNDHYLEVDYDLSQVLFITTANALHTIPPPLLDRMEIIEIPGYTEEEKLEIAKHFLLPRQLEAHGLKPEHLQLSDKAILEIIRRYTREAGVRNLEREIATICRKVAKEVAKDRDGFKSQRIIPSQLPKYLGVAKYRYGQTEEKDEIGVATGLAWTETGGALLQIEAVLMPGRGKLLITGKLGDVMQESVQAAMSYVRSRALQLGLPADFYQKVDIHVHVPEGAIPKDGPSAGITIATALVSALLKVPVKRTVAMTGEITLRGRILPIGGLKEKLLAARRGNVETVLIPKENEKDLKELSNKVIKGLEIILVEHMDEVLKLALVLEKPEELFKEVPPEAFNLFGGPSVEEGIQAH
ncbi:ATP-dependent Lon protease [Thermosulfuriphilus ammonigenes]|uniref:endopeptidase La n=1 Tax=Thermosulfuriphilus ammonigenes TaxID=1936021 RepID=UPI0015ECC6CA|nr:endopeptidase La [Thermosulfuriphilus ammonigenes]MBA2848274.1 ATP-dependent Lon protease [Thermosulfuriphilus ammonigenes]HFB83694.1 endopeptidase La [Thermodesulfatator sp.]